MTKSTVICALIGTLLGGTAAMADNVEIYLSDMLDNKQTGYCIDIARAQGDAANPEDGLQGHTCYSPSGSIGVDQAFDPEQFADGVLYMPEFDVCVEIGSTVAGTSVDLAACDGGDTQKFVFEPEGVITPAAAPEMCFTLGEDTRTGRSDVNQIKVMTLETCSDEQAAYQTWNARTAD